jgi:hypothetical protein
MDGVDQAQKTYQPHLGKFADNLPASLAIAAGFARPIRPLGTAKDRGVLSESSRFLHAKLAESQRIPKNNVLVVHIPGVADSRLLETSLFCHGYADSRFKLRVHFVETACLPEGITSGNAQLEAIIGIISLNHAKCPLTL